MRAALALALAALPAARAHSTYQADIPNGSRVKDPSGARAGGVGHVALAGEGPLNAFGAAFAAAGHKWTEELCRADSDGDGYSNGVELGDPDCEWKKFDTPLADHFITHPGMKDDTRPEPPVDSCKLSETANFGADFNATLPAFAVPSDAATTNTRVAFAPLVAGGADVWVTKIVPVVDNEAVVQRMRLFACSEDAAAGFESPSDKASACGQPVFAWALGGSSYCLPTDTGIRIPGDQGYLMLEVLYDNQDGKEGVLDSSGLQVFYLEEGDLPTDFTAADWASVVADPADVVVLPKESYRETAVTVKLPDSNLIPQEGLTVIATLNVGADIATRIWATVKHSSEEPFLASCSEFYDSAQQEVKPLAPTQYFKLKRGSEITVHCIYDTSALDEVVAGSESCQTHFLFEPAAAELDLLLVSEDVVSSDTPLSLSDITCGEPIATESTGLLAWLGSSSLSAHAIIMMVSWFVIIPLGTLPPLLFKKNPDNKRWFTAHKLMMVLGLTLSLVGVGLAIYNKSTHFDSLHGALGLAVTVLALQQPINGMLRPHKGPMGEKDGKRVLWELAHQNLGRLAVALAVANLWLGVDRFEVYAGTHPAAQALRIAMVSIVGAGALFSAVYVLLVRKATVSSEVKV